MERREMVGASLRAISDDFTRWAPILRAKLRESPFFRFDTVRGRRDGNEIALQVQAASLDTSDHQIVLTLHRDITGELRMRRELGFAPSDCPMTFDPIEKAG